MGGMAARTHTDVEGMKEQFDSLDNLFYGK